MMPLNDKHYNIEPRRKNKEKCYYCGSIIDIEQLKEHKGVLLCPQCAPEEKSILYNSEKMNYPDTPFY